MKRNPFFLFQAGNCTCYTYELRLLYTQKIVNNYTTAAFMKMGEIYGFKYILQVTSSLEFLTKLNMIASG